MIVNLGPTRRSCHFGELLKANRSSLLSWLIRCLDPSVFQVVCISLALSRGQHWKFCQELRKDREGNGVYVTGLGIYQYACVKHLYRTSPFQGRREEDYGCRDVSALIFVFENEKNLKLVANVIILKTNAIILRVIRLQADTATTSTVTVSPYHCFPRYQCSPQRTKVMLRLSSPMMSMSFTQSWPFPFFFFFIYCTMYNFNNYFLAALVTVSPSFFFWIFVYCPLWQAIW